MFISMGIDGWGRIGGPLVPFGAVDREGSMDPCEEVTMPASEPPSIWNDAPFAAASRHHLSVAA